MENCIAYNFQKILVASNIREKWCVTYFDRPFQPPFSNGEKKSFSSLSSKNIQTITLLFKPKPQIYTSIIITTFSSYNILFGVVVVQKQAHTFDIRYSKHYYFFFFQTASIKNSSPLNFHSHIWGSCPISSNWKLFFLNNCTCMHA